MTRTRGPEALSANPARSPQRGLALALLACLMLTACGFQLRSAVELPPALRALHLESDLPDSRFSRELSRSLEQAGVDLRASPAGVYRLQLQRERSSSREVSVDRRARSAERELELSLVLMLRDAAGTPVYGPVELNASKIYRYDPNNVLGKEDEERLINDELRERLTRQVLGALQATARGLQQRGNSSGQ